jgi:hypothetical protein
VVCIMHMKTRSAGFLVDPQNKAARTVFSGFASKPVATISWLSVKTKVVEGFLVWASKSAATVW